MWGVTTRLLPVGSESWRLTAPPSLPHRGARRVSRDLPKSPKKLWFDVVKQSCQEGSIINSAAVGLTGLSVKKCASGLFYIVVMLLLSTFPRPSSCAIRREGSVITAGQVGLQKVPRSSELSLSGLGICFHRW